MGLGIRVCLLLCLVTVACASPRASVLSGLIGSPETCPKPLTAVVDGPLCIVKKLLVCVKGIGGNAVAIIEEITGISTCNGYGDVGNLIIKIGHAVGNIIDQVLPKLGTFLAKVIDAAVRIVVCVGLTPARILLGACPPDVCTKSYGSKYGWTPYDKFGSCTDVVHQCNCEIKEWIKKLTSGDEFKNLKGARGIIVKEILAIAKLTISFTVKITKDHLLLLLSKVTTLLGVVGECIEPKLGTQLIDKVFSLLGSVFGKTCQPCDDQKSDAKDKLKGIQTCDQGIFKKKGSDSSEENKSKEKGSSEEKSKEKGNSEEKSKEKGSSEEKSKEKGSSEEKSKEKGSSEVKSKEKGSSEEKSKESSDK